MKSLLLSQQTPAKVNKATRKIRKALQRQSNFSSDNFKISNVRAILKFGARSVSCRWCREFWLFAVLNALDVFSKRNSPRFSWLAGQTPNALVQVKGKGQMRTQRNINA